MSAKAADDDLLDPSALGNLKPQQSNSENLLPVSLPSAATARQFAASTASALAALVHAYGSSCRKREAATAREKELTTQYWKLLADKEAKLEEYRQGLFCSGCGKTRSEILGLGETFPHSGQTVISATPEQIAAKERELQTEIDRVLAQKEKAGKEREDANRSLAEALNQIQQGVSFWRTSVHAHSALISLEESTSAVRCQAERKRADDQIGRIREETRTATDVKQLENSSVDLNQWLSLRKQGYENRESTRLANQDRKLKAELQARAERDRLAQVASAEAARISDFNSANSLQYTIRFMSPGGVIGGMELTANTRGLFFRMGDDTPERKGEILPQVSSFITQVGTIPAAIAPRIRAPESEQPLVEFIQGRIRSFGKAAQSG